MQSAQISVREVAECGMLEHVVAVPFHHDPVELLLQHPETVNPAGLAPLSAPPRRLLEVTLQIPSGRNLESWSGIRVG